MTSKPVDNKRDKERADDDSWQRQRDEALDDELNGRDIPDNDEAPHYKPETFR